MPRALRAREEFSLRELDGYYVTISALSEARPSSEGSVNGWRRFVESPSVTRPRDVR